MHWLGETRTDQPVHEREDTALAAEVVGQLDTPPDAVMLETARYIVPERHIGAAEPVDALLRVTDEHDARRRRIMLGDARKAECNVALRRIDVLELVHDQHPQVT